MTRNFTNGATHLDQGAAALVGDYMSIKKGETVLITADTETETAAVEAVFRAVRAQGATPSVMIFPQVPFQGALADPYVPATLAPAVKSCDAWIDLTFPYLAGAHAYEEAMATKQVRYLLGGDMGAAGMARLFGSVNMHEYYSIFEKLQRFVAEAVGRTVRITDPLGTDVSFELDKPGIVKPRYADKPGSYLVPGSCGLFPVLESVRGTICFTAIFHEYFASLPEPLVLKVDGKIREVSGPANHRIVLDRALRRAGNGEYGNIIHFTYGMNPAARPTGKSFIEDSRVMGNNAVGMGLPWWIPGGGENHPDGIISNQSIWIDGEQIVRDGTIVGPASIADLAPALQPAFYGLTQPGAQTDGAPFSGLPRR
jgi:2,5-dihydroxypyridine 5,6-dioxygenase